MDLRQANIARLESERFDALVIGGGINGAVSAAALAGKGARVALIDRGDFAGVTSQESSNLAWGGIKYLETFDFALVRKLCLSRNHLIRNFPSTVQEIRFLTSVPPGFRHSRLKLYAGTWLYWLIGNGFTRIPRLLSRAGLGTAEPIIETDRVAGGFEYSDAYLFDNDSRFVFNFVRQAMDHGSVAANYVESLGGTRDASGDWSVAARDGRSGRALTIRARVLINAAGPYVDAHNRLTGQTTEHRHVLSKGVHLIVDRLTAERRVLAFFASDGRLFFVIPMGARTCIGTTDTRVDDPAAPVTDEDRDFILENINVRLRLARPLSRADIIAERWGVRPLAVRQTTGEGRDFLALSRKHAVDVNAPERHISIFGGKLTDCVNVGDEVGEHVRRCGVDLPYPRYRWYGEPPAATAAEFHHRARLMGLDALTAPSASEPLSRRYWRRYGMAAFDLLERIRENPAEAAVLIEGTEYTRGELKLTAHREMVVTLADFLRRRSKIALVARPETIGQSAGLLEAARILFGDAAEARIAEYFATTAGDRAAAPSSADPAADAPPNAPVAAQAGAGAV